MWDGDCGVLATRLSLINVLSPPCGMATNIYLTASLLGRSSKPTVWDGDCGAGNLTGGVAMVLSPPCGMATTVLGKLLFVWRIRSKPTVWDGDTIETTPMPLRDAF